MIYPRMQFYFSTTPIPLNLYLQFEKELQVDAPHLLEQTIV